MKYPLILCFLLAFASASISQLKTYTWESAKKASPDTIYSLDCSGLKWTEVPQELLRFTQLQKLDISKNKLKSLPDEFNVFAEMRIFDCSKNKIDTELVFLCSWLKIEKLLLGKNNFSSVPSCIGFCQQLTALDLWNNPIESLPNDLIKCQNLIAVDMRGISFSPGFQQTWLKQMPTVKWFFDSPCNCLD
jgi:Leucine-rich repeat (LRR) protein